MAWYDEYSGKPWAAIPDPPHSFTCGELVRHVVKERWGLDVLEIMVDPLNLTSCVRALREPERYGLRLLETHERPREYDVAYCAQRNRDSHVGIAVNTRDGLMIMHCMQCSPVCLHSPAELLGCMFKRITWLRFTAMEGRT